MRNIFQHCSIHEKSFYINHDQELFTFGDQSVDFFGSYDEKRDVIEQYEGNTSNFSFPNALKCEKKNYIVNFTDNGHIHPHTQLLMNVLSNSFNIIMIGRNMWNVVLDNVYFMDVDSENCRQLIHSVRHNIKCIYFNSALLFSYFDRGMFPNSILSLLYHYTPALTSPESLSCLRNFMSCIDKICFYSSDDLDYFTLCYGEDLPSTKVVKSQYVVSKISFGGHPKISKKIFLCYDDHVTDAIKFFDQVKTNDSMLILFSDDNLDLQKKQDIKVLGRKHNLFVKMIEQSSVFFTHELQNYTHYNITLALKCGLQCVIPKYFKEFESPLCISFDDGLKDSVKQYKMQKKHKRI